MNTLIQATTRTVGTVVVLIGLLPVGIVGAQEKGSATPSKEELQRLYVDYLKTEGYRPEVDSDGDVRFKREGRTYFIGVSEDDPNFFRVVLANVWKIESTAERSKVLEAADASNAKSKVAKVHTIKDNVWVSVELYLASPGEFKGVFQRTLSGLDNGLANFVKKMRE